MSWTARSRQGTRSRKSKSEYAGYKSNKTVGQIQKSNQGRRSQNHRNREKPKDRRCEALGRK